MARAEDSISDFEPKPTTPGRAAPSIASMGALRLRAGVAGCATRSGDRRAVLVELPRRRAPTPASSHAGEFPRRRARRPRCGLALQAPQHEERRGGGDTEQSGEPDRPDAGASTVRYPPGQCALLPSRRWCDVREVPDPGEQARQHRADRSGRQGREAWSACSGDDGRERTEQTPGQDRCHECHRRRAWVPGPPGSPVTRDPPGGLGAVLRLRPLTPGWGVPRSSTVDAPARGLCSHTGCQRSPVPSRASSLRSAPAAPLDCPGVPPASAQ